MDKFLQLQPSKYDPIVEEVVNVIKTKKKVKVSKVGGYYKTVEVGSEEYTGAAENNILIYLR